MENWVRRIAATYGVSYDAFLKHGLNRTGRAARDLDRISEAELARLSAGTGVPVGRLQEMKPARMSVRVAKLSGWLLTDEGRDALDELRVTMQRTARRRQAYASADAGRLARQNWQVYRA